MRIVLSPPRLFMLTAVHAIPDTIYVCRHNTTFPKAGEFKETKSVEGAADVSCDLVYSNAGGVSMYNCFQGGKSLWSPAVVTLHKAGGKKATVSFFTQKGGATGTQCSGKFDETTGEVNWTKQAHPMVGAKWTRSFSDTTSKREIQIEGIKTEPGGKSLDMFVHWYATLHNGSC